LTAHQERFPLRFFVLFTLLYSGLSVFGTYINLYLEQIGYDKAQIGLVISISYFAVLIGQLSWGALSDRASTKNWVLNLLYFATVLVSLLFYFSTAYLYLIVLVSLYSFFCNPIPSLTENLALEALEGGRWDYGKVRIGGTVGYITTVLIVGYMLQNRYDSIFVTGAVIMLLAGLVSLRLPKVHRRYTEKHEWRASWKQLSQMRQFYGILAYSLCFAMGFGYFHSYYPLYLTSIGGDSGLVGLLMFTGSLLEIPVLFSMEAIIKKLGSKRTLLMAGAATALRWVLMSFFRSIPFILLANALHSIGYIAYFYSIVTYINKTVPRSLRATSHSVNALVSEILPRVAFGYLGGLASERWGTPAVMLINGLLLVAATVLFARFGRMEDAPAAQAPGETLQS
jgi:PPP family 3-phenylpropionic acid transporter